MYLDNATIARLLPARRCIAAVESAFAALGRGEAPASATLPYHVAHGAFHVKVGQLGRYFAAKINANFPRNPADNGLPTIQGILVLYSAEDGRVLATMDSVELTARRTAAASAVAVRALARTDASALSIVGCGVQAPAQLEAVRAVRSIERVFVYDVDSERARDFAEKYVVEAVPDLQTATLQSDIIITCTTSKEFILFPEHVRPGTFIAAVGVDNDTKKELSPALMARARVVTDATHQCARIGDLHHAIDAGVMALEDVSGELPRLLAGSRARCCRRDEIVVFDSTGLGLQDVAAAAALYTQIERHETSGRAI